MSVELICPYCRFSKKIPEKKIPPAATMAVCPRCREKFPLPYRKRPGDTGQGNKTEIPKPDRLQTHPDADNENGGIPWEQRDRMGLLKGIFQTFYKALFQPGDLFNTQRRPKGIREPLAFGLLIGGLGDMLAFFWPALLVSLGFFPFGDAAFARLNVTWIFLTFLVGIPLAVILNMVFYSGFLHLMLLIVRGGKGGYQSTFSVVAYSQSALLWNIIPFMGGWIATVWKLVIQIIGLHDIHQASYLKIILAFFMPFFILILLVLLAMGPFLVMLF